MVEAAGSSAQNREGSSDFTDFVPPAGMYQVDADSEDDYDFVIVSSVIPTDAAASVA